MNSQDLGGPILRDVSRSFYLSVRVLPGELRSPVGLAYLLARASDTIADSAAAPSASRLVHLAAFERMIETGNQDGLSVLQSEIRPPDPGEERLIAHLDGCLSWLSSLPSRDRSEIQRVMARIIHGQTLDLQRFPDDPGPTTTVRALRTAAELEEYTYLVAGCVGEFWTRISLAHLPRYSRIDPEELARIGIDYGKGLQLVNILRDLPADLRDGRCYLPEDQLQQAGIAPDNLRTEPASLQLIFDAWLARAAELLEQGRTYIASIRPGRVRIACYLPWYLGRETLKLMQERPPLQTAVKVKVPRSTVRSALLRAPLVAFSNRALRIR